MSPFHQSRRLASFSAARSVTSSFEIVFSETPSPRRFEMKSSMWRA
jgi:hypothetical protein